MTLNCIYPILNLVKGGRDSGPLTSDPDIYMSMVYLNNNAHTTDVPVIMQFIRELAEYEHEPKAVKATESSLLATLSFAPSPSPGVQGEPKNEGGKDGEGGSGYARALLIFAPTETAAIIAINNNAANASSEDHPGDGGIVAGMALYFYNYSTWHGAPGIYLEDLFVKPQFRGRGYGTQLLTALAKEVKGINGARLEWAVLKWNEPSIRF